MGGQGTNPSLLVKGPLCWEYDPVKQGRKQRRDARCFTEPVLRDNGGFVREQGSVVSAPQKKTQGRTFLNAFGQILFKFRGQHMSFPSRIFNIPNKNDQDTAKSGGKGVQEKSINPKVPTTSQHDIIFEASRFRGSCALVVCSVRIRGPKVNKLVFVFEQVTHRKCAQAGSLSDYLILGKIFALVMGKSPCNSTETAIAAAVVITTSPCWELGGRGRSRAHRRRGGCDFGSLASKGITW